MLIHRVTMDMFEMAGVVDYMVNPVNLLGAPGAGLALEFRRRIPDDLFFDKYRKACQTEELRIGTIQILDETGHSWGVINFPTKRHFASDSDIDDIKRGLEALRETLVHEEYNRACVVMPMLGCGLGKQDYATVYPCMVDYLDDIKSPVFLSMSPQRTDLKPKYLTIAGPLDYGMNDEERAKIDWVIEKTLESWGASLSDYTGIVSGGYPGVDAYVCGEEYNEKFEDTYTFRKTGKKPLVVKPNMHRNGVAANLHLGNLLGEIGDDVILFKPKGHNNNRLSAMQAWLDADYEHRNREGLIQKRVAIFGDKGGPSVSESVIIPVSESDLPY